MERIWTERNDRQRIYIDVGEGNDIYNFMVHNGIFVEKVDGDVLTYNTERFSLQTTAMNLQVLVEYYKKHYLEVSETAQEITNDFIRRAEEEAIAREERALAELQKKEAERKAAQTRQPPQLYKIRIRQRGAYKGILY